MSSGGLRRPDVRELAAIFAGGAAGALLRVALGPQLRRRAVAVGHLRA